MAASPKIIAFKTKINKPKVKKITGKVKKPNIGRKIALRMPKTAADSTALPKLSISTPIGNLEIIRKLTVITNQVTIIPVMIDIASYYYKKE